RFRPANDPFVKPVAEADRIEDSPDRFRHAGAGAALVEPSKLIIIGGKNELAAGAERKQVAVEPFRDSEPSLDSPLTDNLEVMLVTNTPEGVPGQGRDFGPPAARPQAHLGNNLRDGDAGPF